MLDLRSRCGDCRRPTGQPMTTVASSSSEADDLGRQSVSLESRYTRGRLAAAGLHQQPSVRRKPAPRAGNDAPLHVKPIRAAIQRDPGLVQAGFGRHQRD